MFKPAQAVLCITITTILSALSFSQAQPLARHPGDVVKYEVTFDGPNADRIKNVNAGISLRGPIPKDQSGFTNGFGCQSTLTSPKTFVMKCTVPADIATGDYTLDSIGASADEGSASYSSPRDFKVPDIHVENPKKFTPPSVTVTPLP